MTIDNMRLWLGSAKSTWTLPLARPEVEALLAERDVLVTALREIVAIDESFNGSHRYASIARGALKTIARSDMEKA